MHNIKCCANHLHTIDLIAQTRRTLVHLCNGATMNITISDSISLIPRCALTLVCVCISIGTTQCCAKWHRNTFSTHTHTTHDAAETRAAQRKLNWRTETESKMGFRRRQTATQRERRTTCMQVRPANAHLQHTHVS